LKKNRHYFLVHMHRFPLHTEYLQVLGYLTRVQERFQKMRAWYIDRTGVGEPFPELATKSGLKNVQGVELSQPKKQNLMTNLKQIMEARRLHLPDYRDLLNEIGGEIAELTATGKTKFTHRSGAHNDRLWALALAVYGARNEIEVYRPAIAFGHVVNPWGSLVPPSRLHRLGTRRC
jgi:phage FluMu gp28-like protein